MCSDSAAFPNARYIGFGEEDMARAEATPVGAVAASACARVERRRLAEGRVVPERSEAVGRAAADLQVLVVAEVGVVISRAAPSGVGRGKGHPVIGAGCEIHWRHQRELVLGGDAIVAEKLPARAGHRVTGAVGRVVHFARGVRVLLEQADRQRPRDDLAPKRSSTERRAGLAVGRSSSTVLAAGSQPHTEQARS